MNDDQLQFDRTCHVIYSKPCKAEIREKITHHYPESQREAVWERVQIICRLFERLAHRPWRGEKLSQRPGRQLRLHRAFLNAKKQCDKWGDFEMHVAPFDKD